MPRICYENWKPEAASLDVVRKADRILREWSRKGLQVTLRQLYYYFVSHDLFPSDRKWRYNKETKKWVRDPDGTNNAEPNYDYLGTVINKARMAGLIDWDYLMDRTRNLRTIGHRKSPADAIKYAAGQYWKDLWANQKYRPEVWIEKDALVGVIGGVCDENDVPYFSCRGYTSQSEQWAAARRHFGYIKGGQIPIVFHLGDHDPSGIDMTRDVQERLQTFITQDWLNEELEVKDGEIVKKGMIWADMAKRCKLRTTGYQGDKDNVDPGPLLKGTEIRRLALNIKQVRKYNPPPNPAKSTDSRFKAYRAKFGDESWELDALTPEVMGDLIRAELSTIRDVDTWRKDVERQERERLELNAASAGWPIIISTLKREDKIGEIDEQVLDNAMGSVDFVTEDDEFDEDEEDINTPIPRDGPDPMDGDDEDSDDDTPRVRLDDDDDPYSDDEGD